MLRREERRQVRRVGRRSERDRGGKRRGTFRAYEARWAGQAWSLMVRFGSDSPTGAPVVCGASRVGWGGGAGVSEAIFTWGSVVKDILTSERSSLSLLALPFRYSLWERLGTSPGLSLPSVK